MIGLNNLGEAYRILGRFSDAISCQRQALDLARTIDDPRSEALSRHNLGNSYRAIGEPGTAADHFRQALPFFERTGERQFRRRCCRI